VKHLDADDGIGSPLREDSHLGKSSRRKRGRKKAAPKSPLGLELKGMRSPLADIPRDELVLLMAGFGKDQAEKFASTTIAIRDLMSRVDPFGLLACLAAYGIPDFVDANGILSHGERTRLYPAHIELGQLMTLTLGPDISRARPATSRDVGSMFEMLPKWADQFHWKRLSQIEHAATDLAKARLAVQEQMRMTTQMIRNWGFYDQVKRIGLELLTPLDARFECTHAFRITDWILIFDHMFDECQKRFNAHFERLAPMIRAKTVRGAVAAYFKAIPDLEGSPELFEQLMRKRRASLKAAQAMMLSHSDLRLVDCYTFSATQIAAPIGRPISVVEQALKAASYRLGELQGTNVEHAFMNNPVWLQPAIALEGGNYFCPLPQTAFAFLFEMMSAVFRDDPPLRIAYDKRRSDYLEKKTAELFQKAFPEATLTPNFKWQSPDRSQEFETDLIVDMGPILILVEAKSGGISPQARRGAPERLGEDIDRLLIEPSRQSKRLEDAIWAAKAGDPGMQPFKDVFPTNLDRIHRIVRVSVTLEDIGFIHTNVNALKEAGFVPPDIAVAPAVTLADLEIVFDILQSPLERIHYWVQRSVWEGSADYTADEIDLLGVYLNTGLSVGDIHKNTRLVLVGASKPIDEYYEATRHGIAKDKPAYQATQWWRDLLARLEEKKPDRWIEAGIVLLSAGYQQQIEIGQRLKGLVSTVQKLRERASSRNGLVFFASADTSEAIALLVLVASQVPGRFRLMENIASQAFVEHAKVLRCVVIMINADSPRYPYGTLAVFTRPRDA
jgi:hypothetical protein